MQFLIVLSAALALASAAPGYLGAGYIGAPAYAGPYASNILTPSGDTIEVAAAKADHFQAHANANAGLVGHGVAAYGVPAYGAYGAHAYGAYGAHAYGAYGAHAYAGPYASNILTPSGDTIEVAAAKADHFQAHVDAKVGHGVAAYGAHHGIAAYGAHHGIAAYGAPALHAAYGSTHLVDPVAIAAGAPLPVGDTVEVAAAKANHFQAHANARAGHVGAGFAAYGAAPLVDPVAIAAGAPLPVGDTHEVAAAKAAHFQAHVDAKAGLLGRKKRSPGYLGAGVAAYAAPAVAAYAAPVVVAAPARSFAYSTVSAHATPVVASYAAPVAVAAPVRSFGYSSVSAHAAPVHAYAAPAAVHAYAAPAAVHAYAAPAAVHAYAAPVAHAAVVSGSNQYQTQDTLGQYSYGYADSNSAKHETRAFDGTTHGGYSYVDGNGLVQSVKYHADALGFRAHGTNFPVAA